MKNDLNDLKKLVHELMNQQGGNFHLNQDQEAVISRMYNDLIPVNDPNHLLHYKTEHTPKPTVVGSVTIEPVQDFHDHIEVEESLSLEDREKDLIKKALEKHRGKRRNAAEELGISERTLYRKIKEYNIQA
jgi:transcriptional regulator with PAS, ATPase and Fis domain